VFFLYGRLGRIGGRLLHPHSRCLIKWCLAAERQVQQDAATSRDRGTGRRGRRRWGPGEGSRTCTAGFGRAGDRVGAAKGSGYAVLYPRVATPEAMSALLHT
jgi:hypothetical protein